MQFPAEIDLDDLDGSDGFRFDGAAVLDTAGFSVASAGDVNGDGYEDILISAPEVDDGADNAGAVYVIFGKADGAPANLDPSALDGETGFKILGAAAGDFLRLASSAGDFNGDGYDDILVSATGNESSYVIFGKAEFTSSVSVASLNGANGFALPSSGAWSISRVDFNDDGLSDIIIGDGDRGFGDNYGVGATYVVYGTQAAMGASVDVNALNGANGFRLVGVALGGASGYSVSGGGDWNGDGIDDIVIGAPWSEVSGGATRHDAGLSYVVFGRTSTPAEISLGSLTLQQGRRILGPDHDEQAGISVAGLGDINGDGYGDVAIGATRDDFDGMSHIVFGRPTNILFEDIDLASLNTSRIYGNVDDEAYFVAPVGDVNGDGFNDILVGAPHEDAGAAYVVFGAATMPDEIILQWLDGEDGFRIAGAGFWTGFSLSAGDFNGDGFADIVVGAPFTSDLNSSGGGAFVVFGRKPDSAVSRTGTDAAQTIRGGDFDDTLSGLGGADTLVGNDGDDELIGGAGADALNGGLGFDVASYASAAAGVRVDMTNGLLGTGEGAGDTFTSIEELVGSAFADVMVGDASANILRGGSGADQLFGGGGNDTVFWDAADNLASVQGGADSDVLVFTSGAAPISFDLAAHSFESAQGRLTDAGAESWTTQQNYYDHLWRLGTSVVENDDGTGLRVEYDLDSSQNWTSNWSHFAVSGGRDINVLTFDDSHYEEAFYDPDDSEAWNANWNHYQANGGRDINTLTDDDGSYIALYCDPDDAQDWATNWNSHTAGGQLLANDLTADDASKIVVYYDPLNGVNWVSNWNSYDISGNLTANAIVYDDGNQIVLYYDPTDVQAWESNWNQYDSLGRLELNVIENDNGTQVQLDLDASDQFDWATMWSLFDSGGNLIGFAGVNDDGSTF